MAEEYPDFTGGDAPATSSSTPRHSKRRTGSSSKSRAMSGSGQMGKHTLAARSSDLKMARWALFAVAILSVIEGGYALLLTETQVDIALTQQAQSMSHRNAGIELEQLKQMVTLGLQIICGVYMVFGLAFLGLGVLVEKLPIAMTITGIVLYSGMTIGYFLFIPVGIPFVNYLKIFLFGALIMGMMAAFAFKRHEEAARRKAARNGEAAVELA